jgi:hypothetical protein
MVPPDVLEAAAERGTAVHEACAAYASSLFWPCPEELEGYFKSFVHWYDRFVVEVYAVEERVEHPKLGYCGHLDFCGLISGVRPKPVMAVIDYKTPFSESRSWHCQTQAYVEASKEKYGAEIGGYLRLRKDGSLPVMGWVENPAQAFNAFCGALSAYNYIKGKG